MPVLSEQVIVVPKGAREHIVEWLYEYSWVGYQKVKTGMVFYRLPTMRECWQYYTAYNWGPGTACEKFLDRIVLWGKEAVEELTLPQVGELIKQILEEHFPRNEGAFDKADEQQGLYQTNLLHVMETHCRMAGETRRIWDMNLQEVLEIVGMSQAMSGQSLRGKPDEKSSKHSKGHRGRGGRGPDQASPGEHQAH